MIRFITDRLSLTILALLLTGSQLSAQGAPDASGAEQNIGTAEKEGKKDNVDSAKSRRSKNRATKRKERSHDRKERRAAHKRNRRQGID